jgi:4a-hydroxytetrahydrobiopterin dehydratase
VPRRLTDPEIEARLGKLDGWTREGDFITKTFQFETFKSAMRFLNKVARVAEEQEHHPDVSLRYSRVKLSIQTHSEGGLTSWDFGLAKEIERISG